jgi:predicted DNA-binding transcriptional regulator YafY
MARSDQLGRQWKIIQTMLASRTGISVSDLAQDMGCHPRTVYRDLEALQAAGFPFYNEQSGKTSRWSLMDSAKRQIPIPLDLTELMALYFSRDMMKVLKNTIFYDSLETLFQKIKSTLPSEYITYLNRIEKSLVVNPKPYKPYGEYRETIDRVNEAVLQNRCIRIDYFSMHRKEKVTRTVAPYKIWFFDGSFYIIGYCRLRKDVRIFALDRIRNIETTGDSFEIPDTFDMETFMKSSFGVFHGEPVEVKVRFRADIAGYITEKIWHDSQTIEHEKDGSILFTAEVAGTNEIKFWILNWGSKAEVLAPESLREEIRAEAEGMLQTYGSDANI